MNILRIRVFLSSTKMINDNKRGEENYMYSIIIRNNFLNKDKK